MSDRIPIVDYLALTPEPHLVANQCVACGARYFDRRNACASCSGIEFTPVPISTHGHLRAFTIVAFAAEGVPVPFVAAFIDCAGTSVRANLLNIEPDPAKIELGMPVRLTTYSLGPDDGGVEAIGFGFEPASADGGN